MAEKISPEQAAEIDADFRAFVKRREVVQDTIDNFEHEYHEMQELAKKLENTDPAAAKKLKNISKELGSDLQKNLDKQADAIANLLGEKLASGFNLSKEQTEFLQRYSNDRKPIDPALKGDEKASAVQEDFDKAKNLIYLNNDGKLSESEIDYARALAKKVHETASKFSAGEISKEDFDKAKDLMFLEIQVAGDVTALTQNYIKAIQDKKDDLMKAYPKMEEMTLLGKINGENDAKSKRYSDAVVKWANQYNDLSDITGLPINKDPRVNEAMQKLGQLELIDDMLPYNSPKAAPNTAIAPEDGQEAPGRK